MFHAAAGPGAYARVLQGGDIAPWDTVHHVKYDGYRIGIVENFTALLAGYSNPKFLRRVLGVPAHRALHALATDQLSDHS